MQRILTTFILLPLFCFSQKQQNIWYFGDHAGVDFNSGIPVALTNGQTYLLDGHAEGTAVICDSSGSLLFYTNGDKIWNRNQQIMLNGDSLLSSFSSTQSSLIIPKPGSDNLFYLFTTDAFYIHNLQYGFRYSTIDMCLDNSLGGVIPESKNILLLDTVCEKLTAIRHGYGTDYWVMVHKYFSDAFYAYRFTSSGIDDTVITHIGSVHHDNCIPVGPNPTVAAIGYMKASPNGKKLALVTVNTCDNIKELFDFNDSSGVVSNFIDLDLQVDTFGGYGLSFSPDNSKLYFTDTKNVFQYDLNAGSGNPDSIRSSKTQVSPFTFYTNDASDALQIGPDGKIYVARGGKSFLAVINNPNQSGLSCNFQDSAVSLNNETCNLGLPNLIDSYSYSNSTIKCPSGVYEIENQDNYFIYPNPFCQYAILEFKNPKNEKHNLSVYPRFCS
ncbi:MAG TPA: hypothetical protein VE978_22590 [Chitinophagales bacterium]|nr:hypothetical protein [Chitinophagales bacterium]